jgi:molybdenum ABC transporter molybdate-binding protein
VQVWADPALKGAIEALVEDYKKSQPVGWTVRYLEAGELSAQAASSSAKPQVILCTANALDALAGKSSLLDPATARTFAGDRLAIVSTREKDKAVASVGDLPLVPFKGLGLGTAETSVGYYAQQALITDGVEQPLREQLQRYSRQAELLTALQEGEVELAFVFASHAAQDAKLHVATVVPEDLHEDIRYQIVAAKGHVEDPAVLALMKLLTEDPAIQQKLGSYGYIDRATALIENR